MYPVRLFEKVMRRYRRGCNVRFCVEWDRVRRCEVVGECCDILV